MKTEAKPETTMQRFRKKYPRIDYYPDWEVLEAIERLRKVNPGKSTRALLDFLVAAGIKATFQNAP